MAWLYLIIAAIFEVGWAVCLKFTEGFTKLWPSLITVPCLIASFVFLSLSVKRVPIGTAYAVWTGLAIVGIVAIGIIFLHEPSSLSRIIFILLILTGVIGLRFLSPGSGL
jgi:quaternary ammonium compound-resistance protein SugE